MYHDLGTARGNDPDASADVDFGAVHLGFRREIPLARINAHPKRIPKSDFLLSALLRTFAFDVPFFTLSVWAICCNFRSPARGQASV